VNPFLRFGAVCVGLIAAVGLVSALFTGPEERLVILASGIVALVVQLAIFAVVRLFQSAHVMAAWGIGSLMRLVALVLYAVIVTKILRGPTAAALLSFVAFLFVTTVVEPLFLKR
jgi:hypothetical protein